MPGRSSDSRADVIVIGGGPNGLACAHRLAVKGCRVTLLEASESMGGAARALPQLAPGLTPSLAHLVWQLDPRVEKAMKPGLQGLDWAATDIATRVISGENCREIRGGTADGPDAEAWARLHKRLSGFARALEPFRRQPPPQLRLRGNEWGQIARTLLGIRMLGRSEFRELLRLILINAYDTAQDELTDPLLRAALCFDATLGAWAGPRSPNTLILLLDRMAGQISGRPANCALPRGGLPALARALSSAAEAAGVSLRSNAVAAKILVEHDRACGVQLTDGAVIRADLVVSAIGPKTTLLSLAGPQYFDAGLITALTCQKARGATAKLHLALSGMPDFRGADIRSRFLLADHEDEVERAFNPVKYGETPARPVMEVLLPTAFERDSGPQLLSANVQFAPHLPKAGEDAARAAMLEASLRRLEEAAPGITGLITRAELLMPYDIERRFGMAGGTWHHGELSVEQMLFNRPVAALARYETPLPGLWLAGAGSHPGGMSGAAGYNAAEAILKAGVSARAEGVIA